MKTFAVRFRLAASHGGGDRTVKVQAPDETWALVNATLKLEDEGIDRWSLISLIEETS